MLWGDNGDWSKEKRTPVTDKWKPTFKPWIEVVEFENLVPEVVTVTGGATVFENLASSSAPSGPGDKIFSSESIFR